jgi:magnesium chelatase family protein
VGGGTSLRPGEVSLAHNGVLFMDEFPEFDRKVIDVLRQPIEEGSITISRSSGIVKYPSSFIFVVAMNPCPCGFYKSNQKECTCNMKMIEKYQKRISGPIVDRIDMWIEVNNLANRELFEENFTAESSQIYFEKVKICREIQNSRLDKVNAQMKSKDIKKFCSIDENTKKIFEQAVDKLKLSPRSYYRVLKVSRTIADLDNSEQIKKEHLLEALQYRPKSSFY